MAAPDTTLQGLQEIPLPEAISYAPQTVGWLIVAILLAALFAFSAYRIYNRHRSNRYRHEALAELDTLEQTLADPKRRSQAIVALPVLVKRTALSFAPRDGVASLTGDAWLTFLDTTWAAGRFSSSSGKLLSRIAYADVTKLDVPDSQLSELVGLVRDWITHHHARV